MNEAELQSPTTEQALTPDEFVNTLDPDGVLSDIERDVHKELFEIAEIAANAQQLFADAGMLVGMLIDKIRVAEESNADTLERVQIIHTMLTAPEGRH